MSTGFELVPLAIGGVFMGVGAIARAVNGAYGRAREEAAERDLALETATVTFATDMRDLELARRALEASGLAVSQPQDGLLETTVDGRVVRLQQAPDEVIHLVAPVLLGEDAAGQLAVDLDTEYRKLVQARSYDRVIEHARDHGMSVAEERVEDDGSITITLNV